MKLTPAIMVTREMIEVLVWTIHFSLIPTCCLHHLLYILQHYGVDLLAGNDNMFNVTGRGLALSATSKNGKHDSAT
jgi:hypothetical protein